MIPAAHIIHQHAGFYCRQTHSPLPLTLGFDGSAILQRLTSLPAHWLVSALDQLLIAAPTLTGIALPWQQWQDEPQAQQLYQHLHCDYVSRQQFWQLPLWRVARHTESPSSAEFDPSSNLFIPTRPKAPQGEVYRRYDPRIKKTLSFRVADPALDAELFTRWMNEPRVNAFWEMRGPLAQQHAYLQQLLDKKGIYPLIGCFDDLPFGYFEVYWAAEDRIGRHYRWQPYDRGMHLLVGEQQFRGAHYVSSWLRGLSHYLWLDERRTQRLVAEPRFDNARLFRHLPDAGFETVKQFDFPHKRSRLITLHRQHFFSEVGL